MPDKPKVEASSVDFKRGVEYGLTTLRVMARYTLHRTHLHPFRQFRIPLCEVMSRQNTTDVLRATGSERA